MVATTRARSALTAAKRISRSMSRATSSRSSKPKGLNVKMTRDSDVFVPLELRARIANATKDAIFVSIHFNATDANPAANGFEIFSLTPRGAPSTADDALALRFMNMEAGSPVDAPSLALSMSVYHSVRRPFLRVRSRDQARAFRGPPPDENPGDSRRGRVPDRTRRKPADRTERLAREARASRSRPASSITRSWSINKTRPMMVADYRRELKDSLSCRDINPPDKLESSPAPVVIPTGN